MLITVQGISKDLEPVPPGQYVAQVASADYQVSRNGNQMLVVSFRLTEPSYEGRLITERFVVDQPVARRRLAKLLRVTDVQMSNDSFDTEDLVGKHVLITVEHEQGDEAIFERVRSFSRA